MDEATEYERAIAPVVDEMREHLLLARVEIRSTGPGPHADFELAALERLRRTLAAIEQRLETLAAARRAGYDEGFRNGLTVGRRALEAAAVQAAGNVVALRPPRAITALATAPWRPRRRSAPGRPSACFPCRAFPMPARPRSAARGR